MSITVYKHIQPALNDKGFIHLKVPSADAKVCFATPVDLIAAPGANIDFHVLKANLFMKYNSAAYDADFIPQITTSGATTPWFTHDIGTLTANRLVGFNGIAGDLANYLNANNALVMNEASADSAAGDSDIFLWIWYLLVDLAQT